MPANGSFRIGIAVLALLVTAPPAALAQKTAFVDAFVDFHSALFGTYGDEGPQAMAALDRMSASLDEWERARSEAEAELRRRAGATATEWALLHADSHQLENAIAAMKEAIAAEPARAPLYLLLGRLHEEAGQAAAAADAFAAARSLDPSDLTTAYLASLAVAAQRGPNETSGSDAVGAIVATLIAAYDRPGLRPAIQVPEFALVRDLSASARVFATPAYEQGFALVDEGRFRAAIESFRASAATDPLIVDPAGRSNHLIAGIAALRRREGTTAVAELEAAVREHPSSSEAHRVLGIVYRAVGRLAESITQLEAAVTRAPLDERARVTLGSVLFEARRLDEAERVLTETIARVPASGEARWMLSRVYEQLDRSDDAMRVLEDAASLRVVAGKAHLYWRIAQMAHGYRRDHARVIDVLTRRVRLVPNEPHAHKDLGLAYSRAGRDDEALIELLMAALLGHEDAEMLTAIGQIHLNRDRLQRAEAALVRAVALDPDSAQTRYVLGRTLQRLGRTAEATEQLTVFDRLRAAALDEQRREYERAVSGAARP